MEKEADASLTLRVLEIEGECLGIDVSAVSRRFAGSTLIYAGAERLDAFSMAIAGFPSGPGDRRICELGMRDAGVASGFATLIFHCLDGSGHSVVAVTIEDEDRLHSGASASFSFAIEAADLDRFVSALLGLERARAGSATLPAAL